MANKVLVTGTIAILVVLARAQSLPPAAKSPWPLGKPFSAVDLPQIPPPLALLIHFPNSNCRDLISLHEEYRKTAAAQSFTLVSIAGEKCGEQVPSMPQVSAGRELGPNAVGFLVEKGILRRMIRTDRLSQMLAEVAAWQGGRQIYDAQCARCHGLDGLDTNYPSIKTLAGIGNRASEAEIIEMTEMTGAVDLHALNEKDRQALAAYVAGL